jgi:uncharacterized oxidoreductase
VVEPIGALLPFGEHKGAGLALICELLGGALAGGATARAVTDGRRRVLNSMFSILVDPERLGTAANLAREMEEFVAYSTASPPQAGVDRVRTPGEPEREMRARRLADGIPVDSVTWAEIVAAGAKVGLAGRANRVAGTRLAKRRRWTSPHRLASDIASRLAWFSRPACRVVAARR